MLDSPLLEPEAPEKKKLVRGDVSSPFANINLLDFCESKVRDEFGLALATVPSQFPIQIPVVVNGKETFVRSISIHPSPNEPALEVTHISRADIELADKALESAQKTFPAWRDRPVSERAELLEQLADLLEENRYELAALQNHEVGKPWREADGDVAEAIDFCRYYARRSLIELSPLKQGDMAGEDNILFHLLL